MVDTVLQTKLYIPPLRSNYIPRPQLNAKLNTGLDGRLTLISAPAGYGKTTLTTEWLQHVERTVVWLSLDESDNDPSRFMTYLIAGLQQVQAGIGETTQSLLQSPQAPPPDAILTTLLNDIASVKSPFFLVLDDYHLIHTLPIHQQLDFLVEHQPPQMHLIMITREDPPLPIARLRGHGQLTEIRQNDLRFSLQESAQFLRQVMGLDLVHEQVEALARRTEGWVAGLQMAALSLQGREEKSEYILAFTGSNRYILDYLLEEVFEQQPAEIQDFLLKTSILERLSGPLCDAVLKRNNSRELLLGLEQANLFVVPLDQTREWYRYHPLFTELLRYRCKTSPTCPEEMLHSLASQWYEDNGFMIQAVQHALAAKNWDEAGRVIERATEGIIRNGQLATLHRWINVLPDAIVRKNFYLATTKGWVSLLMGQFETARIYAELAGSLPAADGTGEKQAPLTALRASLALTQGDVTNTIELSRETLELIENHEEHFLRGMALNNLAQANLLMGDLPAATATYRQMIRLSERAGHSPATISAMANLAALLHQGGKRREAILLCKQALDQCTDSRGRPLPLAGYVHIPMGILNYEANDLASAQKHLLKGIEHGDQLGVVTGVAISGKVALAQLQQALGEKDAALATIAEVRQLASQFNLGYANITAAGVEADILLKQGNIESASRWEKTAGLSPTDTILPSREGDHLTYARLLLAQSRMEEVDTLLTNFERFAHEGGRQRSLITVYVLQALALQAQGQVRQAATLLEKALHLAAPEDYRRAFLDEGQPLIDLIPRARHVEPSFVDQLLEDTQTEPGLERPPLPLQPLVEPLSERELEVLGSMAEGLSNREISERLYVTVGTVKSHVHHILEKLECGSRTQAVARAREKRLL